MCCQGWTREGRHLVGQESALWNWTEGSARRSNLLSWCNSYDHQATNTVQHTNLQCFNFAVSKSITITALNISYFAVNVTYSLVLCFNWESFAWRCCYYTDKIWVGVCVNCFVLFYSKFLFISSFGCYVGVLVGHMEKQETEMKRKLKRKLEMETGNWKWKWEQKMHQSLVQCFLHSVLSHYSFT